MIKGTVSFTASLFFISLESHQVFRSEQKKKKKSLLNLCVPIRPRRLSFPFCPLCCDRHEFRGRTHNTRRQRRRRATAGGNVLVGLRRLCGPPPDHHSLPGRALEVPVPSAAPHPREPAVGLGAPQHPDCAQARQHQQRQQRLGPQRRRLSPAAVRQHVVSSLRARELWLWAAGVHSSGNNASESHQCLLQSLTSAEAGRSAEETNPNVSTLLMFLTLEWMRFPRASHVRLT